jgi:hypothetical protein
MDSAGSDAQFPTTCSSRTVAARDRATAEVGEALASLGAPIWLPILVVIRGKGHATLQYEDSGRGATFDALRAMVTEGLRPA